MKLSYWVTLLILIGCSAAAQAQSTSFEVLYKQFKDTDDVHSISVGGFFCRTVLWMAGEEEFKEAIKELDHIRMITIPKENFRQQNLTLGGFRKVLRSDKFESLALVKEEGQQFEIFLQENDNKRDRYFVLIEDAHEVVGIELKGEIDIEKLSTKKQHVEYRSL